MRAALPSAFLLLAAAAGCGGERPRGPAEPLNVILISIDSLRADRLGCYGHRPEFAPEIPVSPQLDALAAEGAVFDAAWSTTSWTLPAHMALLTGLSDRVHGVVNDEYALHPQRRSVAQEFQDAGYATAGFYSGPYLDPRYGFGRGFARYESALLPFEQAPAEKRAEIVAELRRLGAEPTPKNVTDRWSHWDVTSPRVSAGGIEFLEQSRDRPFFLFLHYFDAHYDYIPDAAEAGLGARFDPEYRGTMDGARWYFNPAVIDQASGERRIGERDLRHVMALYDAEIHWVDRHIGALLQRLKDLGLYERTIVCVTADHGDEFFEHGGIGHRSTLYQELTRIPLILRIPGGTPPGRRVPELVRIYDLAPTLLDYALGGTLAETCGASLRPYLEGDAAPPRALQQRIFGFHRGRVNIREGYRDPRFAVLRQLTIDPETSTEALAHFTQRTWTAQQQPALAGRPRYDVFDRSEERAELHALAPADPRYRQALTGACRLFQELEARAARLPHPAFAPPPTAEDQAVLAQLGYADDPSASEVPPRPPLAERHVGPFPPPCPE